MNNLLKRVIFGGIFVGILVFSILFSKVTFILLFLIIMNLSLYEFNRLINLQSIFPYVLGNLLFVFANITNLYHFSTLSISKYAGIALFLGFFATFISILFSKKEEAVDQLGKKFLSVVYIAVPYTLIVLIPFLNNEYKYVNITVLGIFILVWINDSFAYLVGSSFGKHKLLKRISPNKTWEGFLGGMIFTILGSYVLAHYFDGISFTNWVVFAFIVSIFGVLGDLIESMFKRQAGVKDSSNMIPGHGGFLDRMDSVIFSAPFIFIYLFIVM